MATPEPIDSGSTDITAFDQSRPSETAFSAPTQTTPLRGAVVLETDVNGLGAMRSLKSMRPAPQTIVGVDFTPSIGFRSRSCPVVSAPPPTQVDGIPLRDFLIDIARNAGGPLALFPCGDRTVRHVCRHRSRLEPFYRMLLPDSDLVESLINKDRFADLARRNGALVPSHAVVSPEPGAAAAGRLRFPLIAKPLNLAGFDPVRSAFKAKLFNDAREWDHYFATWACAGRVLIQEHIPGEDSDIYFHGGAWHDGHEICGFTGRKIRQQPRGHGSTVMASCERNDDVHNLARQFLREIRFTGLCDVEYKRDSRDGRYFLIEVNPRQGQWHRIGRLCGIDLIQAAYLTLSGIHHKWPEQLPGSSGYWSYQFQDVARLVDDWRRGEASIGRWLRPYLSMPQDGVFNWRDPRPWLAEFADLARKKLLGDSTSRQAPGGIRHDPI